jgi:dipeptidyl aminopeptidase/acylaminoacyl peptidase
VQIWHYDCLVYKKYKSLKKLLSLFIFILPTIVFSQINKKLLDFSVYDAWKSISNREISNDGLWISYELVPYVGNSSLELYSVAKAQKIVVDRARYAKLSANSNFVAYRIQADADTVRALKMKKVKREKMPKDSLGIYVFSSGEKINFPKLKSFQIADESSDWLILNYEADEKKEAEEDTTAAIKPEKKVKKTTIKDKNAPKTSDLTLYNPINKAKLDYKNCTESDMSKNGSLIAFIRLQNDSVLKSTIFVFDTQKQQLDSVFSQEGVVKKLKIDHSGNQLAFIFSTDTVKENTYALYLWSKKIKTISKIADTTSVELPSKWTVSDNGSIFFSDNDNRLFFGAALKPQPELKDTLLDEEKVVVDIWSWTDARLQPEQLNDVRKDLNKTYISEYLIDKKKLFLLADEKVEDVSVGFKANQPYFLANSEIPYQKAGSWDSPSQRDFYRINAETGKRELILEAQRGWAYLSPAGDKVLYFDYEKANWFVKDLSTQVTTNLTSKLNVAFYDEQNDYPMLASSYGMVNWEENGKYVLIYDHFDIWKFSMDKSFAAINLTNNYGRNNAVRFHYMRINPDEEYLKDNSTVYLSGFYEKTKQEAYYTLNLGAANTPKEIYRGDFALSNWEKAKNSNQLIFQRETCAEFPDIWTSAVDFKQPVKISKANPQQEEYNWCTVELVKWITTEGTTEEGLLYKPENFDSTKKYPMMVYFYDVASDELNHHIAPRPSRSIINPTFYASNGYLVFVPNIRYKIGYPGQSAYNYVVSGTLALLNSRPYIDRTKLGLQGQSWGGYQVAYIVTQTDMFAAASPGAPVSNMTSAYGGIRWESGMSRMFQYEKTQSRIGGTLWEKPFNYIENSPIFYVPKIKTPMLIRHDDADGAVPWYQGIELFVALRRLDKPAWLVNYNGQPHNLKDGSPDCKDWSIRMMQFFDVYLKDADAPQWMVEGIPAVKKGMTMGYDLIKKTKK